MSAGTIRLLWTLTAISAGCLGIEAVWRAPGASVALAAVPSDGPVRGPLRPLPFFYDLYTFRAEDGLTAVVAAFAVEAGNLEPAHGADNRRYRFNVSLLLADTALGSVINRHDSVFADLPRRVSGDHLLCAHIEVRAPPSRTIRQGVFMNDVTEGSGQMYWEDYQIPDYSGNELMLSDVALGQPGAQFGWTRGDAMIALLPTDQLPSRAFDVYYEIYNLPEGNPYTTEITVDQVTGSPPETAELRELIRLSFAGEAAASDDGTLPELRSVVTPFGKGRYRLTVTVKDLATGTTASRSRTFEVPDSGRGATMVPALQVAPLIRGEGGA